jgi:hypothetical protein
MILRLNPSPRPAGSHSSHDCRVAPLERVRPFPAGCALHSRLEWLSLLNAYKAFLRCNKNIITLSSHSLINHGLSKILDYLHLFNFFSAVTTRVYEENKGKMVSLLQSKAY